MFDISKDELEELMRKAQNAMESGDPADAEEFSRAAGLHPVEFAIKMRDSGGEFSLLPQPMKLEYQQQWDAAVASGNRRHALRALHAQVGYEPVDASFNRGGAHDAPGATDAPIWDMCGGGIYPEDFYSFNGLRYYGTGDDKKDAFVYEKIRNLEGKPNTSIVVYRSVEKDSPHTKINPGDWVTPVRSYAVEHAASSINGEARIMSKTVNANEIYCDGNSMLEWGYHPQERAPNFTKWKDVPFIAMVARHSRESADTKVFRANADSPLTPVERAIAGDLTFERTHTPEESYWVRSSLTGGIVCAFATVTSNGSVLATPSLSDSMLQGINAKVVQAALGEFQKTLQAEVHSAPAQERERDESPAPGM